MRLVARTFAGSLALAVAVFLTGSAVADTQTWNFDLQTSGADTFYISPTATCNTAPDYQGIYEISLVEVTVSYLGFSFGPFDVTDQIPPDQITGEDSHDGPPPFTVLDDHIQYPAPPTSPTLAADMLIEVAADGYGHVSATNIILGTAVYDVGWPFGEVEVQLETVRVAGTVWVTPLIPADLDGDGAVDLADLAQLLGHYGTTGGATYEDGDLDGDGDVDLADLAELLANYGQWDC